MLVAFCLERSNARMTAHFRSIQEEKLKGIEAAWSVPDDRRRGAFARGLRRRAGPGRQLLLRGSILQRDAYIAGGVAELLKATTTFLFVGVAAKNVGGFIGGHVPQVSLRQDGMFAADTQQRLNVGEEFLLFRSAACRR